MRQAANKSRRCVDGNPESPGHSQSEETEVSDLSCMEGDDSGESHSESEDTFEEGIVVEESVVSNDPLGARMMSNALRQDNPCEGSKRRGKKGEISDSPPFLPQAKVPNALRQDIPCEGSKRRGRKGEIPDSPPLLAASEGSKQRGKKGNP